METLLKIRSLFDTSVSLKLLRARQLPLIVAFLYREFKHSQQITVPYHVLVHRLSDFLEEHNYTEEEEHAPSHRLHHDFADTAKQYLDRWIDAHYLRNIVDESSKEPYVLLSKHTEKVFQVFEILKEKEFVGTESKFKDIFHKLRDIVENANPDQEKRLEDLEKKKLAIEKEIRKIKIDGYVSTYEDYQIRSRFEEVNRLANDLIGDFKEVEDNFKEITQRIYEKQQSADLSKGQLIADTFDALYALKSSDQGKSFYAFWQFVLDEESQQEFYQLTKNVYQVLEDREIEIPSRFLRKLKPLLHAAARKVLEKNTLLADKLTREIVAKNQPETRQSRELMSAIRHLALQRLSMASEREYYLELEEDPVVYLPLERKLSDRSIVNTHAATATPATLCLEDIEDFTKLYKADLIDKDKLLSGIQRILQDRAQVSLKEVVDEVGLTKGLAELLAYFTLVNSSDRFFINSHKRETILFNRNEGKFLDVPQILFTA